MIDQYLSEQPHIGSGFTRVDVSFQPLVGYVFIGGDRVGALWCNLNIPQRASELSS